MNINSCYAYFALNKLFMILTSAVLACVFALPAHSSTVFSESVGFTSSPRGHVLIPVSIDGSEPLVFVLDTGAARTLVTPVLAERLELARVPGELVSTLGTHGNSENAVVRIRSIAIGQANVADIEAIVLDLDHITRGAWHVDGVLGMDFLRKFDVRLEFEDGLVSLYEAAMDHASCLACPAGIDGIAFRVVEPGFIVMPATVNTQPVEALLDTGSGHSGLNMRAATALGVNFPPVPTGAPSGHRFGLQTGPVRVGNTTLSERTELHVMDHPVMEALGLAERPSMLMGTDQLAKRTVTISYGLDVIFLQ